MIEQSATSNEKQILPVHWVEEDGFEVTPSVPPTDTRLLLNPSLLIQGDLPVPPPRTH